VGAHYGYTTIALAELVGADGHVYAFEPSLSTAGHLNRTRVVNRLPQVKVVPLALGEPGDLRILPVPVSRGMANHALGGPRWEDVYVIGFEQLWNGLGGRQIHGVKIDVQGMEMQVLEGMVPVLTAQRPKLAIEFHTGVDRNPILDLLTRAGYRLPGKPIEPLPRETQAAYHDDHSYAFEPSPT
jgi:FkbM family methyltransferase